MADFTAPSWLFPKEGPFDNFIKGSQAGSAIAANRIRAKQVYADIQQNQEKMDLSEREQVTRNEASNLHNEVIRTKLNNDAADFQALKEWWPKFQESDGEISPPTLYNENTMLKVSGEIAQKRAKVGMAAFAEFMATPGRDLTNPEDQVQYYNLLSQYKNIPDKLGPQGVMTPIKMAEDLKRLKDEAASKIASRSERSALNTLIEQRRSLLADSTIDLNDARIAKYDKDIALEERRLLLGEGNLKARGREMDLKEQRQNATGRWSAEDKIEFQNRAKKASELMTDPEEADRVIQEIREDIEGKRQQREGFKSKVTRESLKNPVPTVTPPAVVAPAGTNSPSALPLRKQGGNTFQQQPDGTWKFIGPAQ